MKLYSFIKECGTVAAGIIGYEGGVERPKSSITSKPVNSLLKAEKKDRGSVIKKSDSRVKSLVK